MRYTVEEIPVEMEVGEIRTRAFDGGGTYTRHIDLPAGTDFTPLLAGLPGDLCGCPHWGQVLEGSITLRYADGHEETCRAGDVYYWPAGHTGWTDTGVVFLELSPTAEIMPVLEHLSRQLAPT
jgi:hypothetical protein